MNSVGRLRARIRKDRWRVGARDNERVQAGHGVSAADARKVALHLQPARFQSRCRRHLPHPQGQDSDQRRHDSVGLPRFRMLCFACYISLLVSLSHYLKA